MKKVVRSILAVPFVLGAPLALRAQSYDEGSVDYSDYFGEGGSEEQSGPQSLEEAQRTGRGYRVGTNARGPSVPDRYTVRQGDTLWSITGHYLGDPWQWPQVWSYNPEITNPHWIYPDASVRLTPALGDPTAEDGVPKSVQTAAAERGESVRVVVPLSEFSPGTVFLRDQGYLDDEAFKASGAVVGAPEEHMLLSVSDEAYVEFAEGVEVRPGQQFSVFRRIEQADRLPRERGTLVRISGTFLVRGYDQERHIARGVISETIEPIERGFRVAEVERRFDLVPPRRNAKDLVAKIIATVQQRALISEQDVVFIDAGEEQGVEPGNRFFVVRRGDEWRDSLRTSPTNMGSAVPGPPYRPGEYPDEVVAELRVVKVRKNVSIALMTRTNYDIGMGERVEMRQGF